MTTSIQTKNIIFDIDGTLWDATHRIAEAYNEVITAEDPTYPLVSVDQMAKVMGLLIEEIADLFFPYLDKEKRLDMIHRCCNHENDYLVQHGGTLYEGVPNVLSILKEHGYRLFIVSNCQDGYIDALFAAHPIGQYFEDGECSGRTGRIKGENIKLLMERNQLDTAIYVGDTQKDKDACTLAQIPFIFADYGFGSVDSYDYRISNFKALLTIFGI